MNHFSMYISGKISGLTDLNKPKFETAENFLRFRFGTDSYVINPHKINHSENSTYSSYMRKDIAAMLKCEWVIVLDDWKNSRGAIVEVLLANFLQMPVYPVHLAGITPIRISTGTRIKLLIKLLLNRF